MTRLTVPALLVLLFSAVPASAQGVRIEFHDGYVNLSARNATVRQILAEWARQGQTRVVNAERVTGGPVTLELQRMPEQRALETILRGTSGYLLAARPDGAPGASTIERIMVMPPSTAARAAPAPPGPMGQPGPPQPFTPGFPQPGMQVDEPDEPIQPGFVPDQDDAPPQMPVADDGELVQQPGFVPGMRGGVDPGMPMDPDGDPPAPPQPGPSPLVPGVVVSPSPGVIPAPQPQQPRPQ
jgi:hypothetical protein